jgi:hypothetical protein
VVTGNEHAVAGNKNWVDEAEFSDRSRDLHHLLGGVRAGITVTRNQSSDGPPFDLDIKIFQSHANAPLGP